MKPLNKAVLALVAGLMMQAGGAWAGSCGASECWGAVGVGPGGAWGYSHSWHSEAEAIDAAHEGCEWDCTDMFSFYNGCAAIALTPDQQYYGRGFGWTRSDAEAEAYAACSAFGTGCAIRVWACSK